ncbi:RNA-binding domain-containing protein [Mobilicoccus caccae]|uniref:Transcriptional regulator n=1 Tax=Mobilicoccus caccae TaxID=1859295 RepID=A0ABQ6IYJ0_9MICO|nr:RNA-binding domain-containing protein [Mobilicoccus caccae]GMA41748.1 transcriptional regulator [Mobilicoccus caccae]
MTLFGGDAVQRAVDSALVAVRDGSSVPERRHFDFKEEAGRRGQGGVIRPGLPENEPAAKSLAGEVACMANTPGGGALIVGVADDGTPIGTDLDVDWLQKRLYQLLHHKLATIITEESARGRRLLVIRCPPAVEPLTYGGRTTWRVGDQCHDIDLASWHARRSARSGFDWSNEPSGIGVDQARVEAVSLARSFLRDAQDDRAADLAEADTPDLLRRLAVVTGEGDLTNAGALLFHGRETPALDYIRRSGAGADSEARVNVPERSLLEELSEVFATARAYNPEAHVDQGLVIGRPRLLPERALREAIVNGVTHRDWTDPGPTFVEHVGATLRVTSPGGFFGGVRPDNIINHPPISRNTSLSAALALLRVAERQGIGVDRMFGDMIRVGHPLPDITEVDGRSVLAVLAGENPDTAWMLWLRDMSPDVRGDLRVLMSLDRLARRWWVDALDLAPYLQVTATEADQVMHHLRGLGIGQQPVTFDVPGVPPERGVVLGLTTPAWDRLARLSADTGRGLRRGPTREQVALAYAHHMGRISTTELGGILGAHSTNVGSVLRRLEAEGRLGPSRENRRGAGFFYRYVPEG